MNPEIKKIHLDNTKYNPDGIFAKNFSESQKINDLPENEKEDIYNNFDNINEGNSSEKTKIILETVKQKQDLIKQIAWEEWLKKVASSNEIISKQSFNLTTNQIEELKSNIWNINSAQELRKICEQLNIDPKKLQKHLEVKEDWIIWKQTYRAFVEVFRSFKNLDSIAKESQVSERITWREINNEYLEKLNLPKNFNIIWEKFLNKLWKEILKPSDPLALVDAIGKKMAYIINWKFKIVDIIIWKNWISRNYKEWDKKTIVWEIHKFDPSISKIAKDENWHAGNSEKAKTVKSASLQSKLSMNTWWRYFHWVQASRIPNWWTFWCVWVDPLFIRKMYADVIKNWWGYWYVDVA